MGRSQPGKILAPPATTAHTGGAQPDSAPPQNNPVTHPIDPATLPENATLQQDGSVLFKQNGDLFKQVKDPSGAVVGLMYKGPRMLTWSTMSAAQVRSRLGIYTARSEKGEVSEAVQNGLDEWTWAYGLFGTEQVVNQDNMETIHEPGEGAAA